MILLTGGAGFIGSHTAIELLSSGHSIVIADNFSNSQHDVVSRITVLSGADVPCYEGNVSDSSFLQQIFERHEISDVIHFAGSKSVAESVEHPLDYYENNVTSTLNLLKVMAQFDTRSLVFSSSATVYGASDDMPLVESMSMSPASNPYGLTKQIIEMLLVDLAARDPRWAIASLRYFNPVGAHPSGLIGECSSDKPNNLMPILIEAASGVRDYITIFGDDYDTPDGTGIRDFIHVVDLARGHVSAVNLNASRNGHHAYNLGTGRGTSVFELIETFESVTGQSIKRQIGPRRSGDVAVSYADVSKARQELSWRAEFGLEAMCQHAWQFYRRTKGLT